MTKLVCSCACAALYLGLVDSLEGPNARDRPPGNPLAARAGAHQRSSVNVWLGGLARPATVTGHHTGSDQMGSRRVVYIGSGNCGRSTAAESATTCYG
jgi:hypothetical protein